MFRKHSEWWSSFSNNTGYIHVEAAPTATHPSGLSLGQIKLSWSTPKYGDYKPAGYVITCSHLRDMTQSVRCHDEVIPLESTNLVIEGRDVYTPFYSAVQVVRNFNGEEIIDDVSSPASSLICAGMEVWIYVWALFGSVSLVNQGRVVCAKCL